MNNLLNSLGIENPPAWLENTGPVLQVVLILLLAWAALNIANRGIRKLRQVIEARSDNPEDQKRIRTLGRVFRYIANVVSSAIVNKPPPASKRGLYFHVFTRPIVNARRYWKA